MYVLIWQTEFPLNIIPFVLLYLLISIEMMLLKSLECFVGIMAHLFY
jgi:hypothetical protein